jgi:hypothetical protein
LIDTRQPPAVLAPFGLLRYDVRPLVVSDVTTAFAIPGPALPVGPRERCSTGITARHAGFARGWIDLAAIEETRDLIANVTIDHELHGIPGLVPT